MAPGIIEGPSPPPESASWKTCLCDLQEWIGVVRYSGLIDLACSVGLPVLIWYALGRRPLPRAPGDAGSPTPAGSGTRRDGQSRITPPLGLADVVPRSTLLAARRPSPGISSLTTGKHLVEIFAVSVNFPFVGTIDICDGCWCKNIYRQKDCGGEYKKFRLRKKKWYSSDVSHSALFEDKLVLTGPTRCISSYGGVLILLDIPSTKKKDREIRKLVWNVEDDLSMYDNPKTKIILTNRGNVYLTCAVVSNAVDAYVQVKLRLPYEVAVCTKVHGHINARIDTFNIGSTLFSKDVIDALDVSISKDSLPDGHSHGEFCHPIILPLDRSVLALPVGGCLEVKGELVFNDSNVVHVKHLIPIKDEEIESQWVQDNNCHTSVNILIRS